MAVVSLAVAEGSIPAGMLPLQRVYYAVQAGPSCSVRGSMPNTPLQYAADLDCGVRCQSRVEAQSFSLSLAGVETRTNSQTRVKGLRLGIPSPGFLLADRQAMNE